MRQNSLLHEHDNKLSKENEELVNQLLEKEEQDKKYRRNIYNKYRERENLIISIIKTAEKTLQIILCLLLFYLSYKQTNNTSPNFIISSLYFFTGLYTLLCNFIQISFFQEFEFLFKKLNDKIFIKLNQHYTKVCEKEINMIFNIK